MPMQLRCSQTLTANGEMSRIRVDRRYRLVCATKRTVGPPTEENNIEKGRLAVHWLVPAGPDFTPDIRPASSFLHVAGFQPAGQFSAGKSLALPCSGFQVFQHQRDSLPGGMDDRKHHELSDTICLRARTFGQIMIPVAMLT